MAEQTSRRNYMGRSFSIYFSNFSLEDNVDSKEGCIVRKGDRTKMKWERLLWVYYRRRKVKGAKL